MHSTGSIPRRWSVADSRETYAVRKWGGSHFDISETGNLTAFPSDGLGETSQGQGIDLKELVDEVRERGIGLPLLIMFKVVCDHTPPLRVVGALIGAPLVRATKEEPAPARKVKVVIEDPPLPEGEPGAPEASPSDALAARVATPT